MPDEVNQWLEMAQYDLGTAEDMLQAGRYLHVGFYCQQALEKILKAIYVARIKKTPPRIHNLLQLVELCNIKINATEQEFFAFLNEYYVESRYPAESLRLMQEVDHLNAQSFLKTTKDIYQCLRQKVS